jgi:GT2 family glycosyltransferase
LGRTTKRPIRLLTINYDPLSDARLESRSDGNLDVIDIDNVSTAKTGFAENHNLLFKKGNPSDSFIIINPDCIPQAGSIDALLRRKEEGARVGIVEGRQWPFEHPKEYDPLSLETPWASGAFCLIDVSFYRRIGGMDDLYFLYLEDVDLSWQAWLNGYSVLYEPGATVTHFSGGRYYRDDLVSSEHFLGLRNFLIISRKFFGSDGERRAVEMLNTFPDKELADAAVSDYFSGISKQVSNRYAGRTHAQVKILGINRFHILRTE